MTANHPTNAVRCADCPGRSPQSGRHPPKPFRPLDDLGTGSIPTAIRINTRSRSVPSHVDDPVYRNDIYALQHEAVRSAMPTSRAWIIGVNVLAGDGAVLGILTELRLRGSSLDDAFLALVEAWALHANSNSSRRSDVEA